MELVASLRKLIVSLEQRCFSSNRKVCGSLFLFIFGYTAVISLLIQFYILPVVFPGLHYGHGLLTGTDSAMFHEYAFHYSNFLNRFGLSEWELNRDTYANLQPASVAAIFYSVFVPEPWVLIPLNSLVHGAGGVVLYLIFWTFGRGGLIGVLSTLPYLLYPSAAVWYAQIHRDGFTSLGYYSFFLGFLLLLKIREKEKKRFYLLGGLGAFSLGVLCLYMMRPYMLVFMIGFILMLVAYFYARYLFRLQWRARIANFGMVLMLVCAIFFLFGEKVQGQLESVDTLNLTKKGDEAFTPSQHVWFYISKINHMRDIYFQRFPDANSYVDKERLFLSIYDVVSYVPRAITIGLFSPFPAEWFGEGNNPGGSVQRRIVGVEMLCSYVLFLGVPWAFVAFRKNWLSLSIIFLGIFVLMMPMIYAIPNIGTLYRMKFPFVVLILGFGVQGWAVARERFFN